MLSDANPPAHYTTGILQIKIRVVNNQEWYTWHVYRREGVHGVDVHQCVQGVLQTMLGNMMRRASHQQLCHTLGSNT